MEIGDVEGRVVASQPCVDGGEVGVVCVAQAKRFGRVFIDVRTWRLGRRAAVDPIEVRARAMLDDVFAFLGCEHQTERRVGCGVNRFRAVRDDGNSISSNPMRP